MMLIKSSSAPGRLVAAFFALLALVIFLVTWGCGKKQVSSQDEFDPVVRRLLIEGTDALKRLEFDRALVLADSAAKRTPNNADLHFLRGRIYSELVCWDDAEASYRKTLDLLPDYRGVWNNLGNNEYRKRAYNKAITCYKKELEHNQAAIPWTGMGRTYIQLGKNDSARYAFEQAIVLDSTYAPAYFNMALLEDKEGNPETAFERVSRALSLAPDNLDYRYQVGAILVKMARSEEALQYLEPVAEARPWHHATYYNLGQAYIRLGWEEKAQEYMERAESLRAQDAEISHLENSVVTTPWSFGNHAALGVALRRAGRYNDAMHAYMIGLHLDPQNPEIMNNLASLCLLRGDTTLAINYYRTVLMNDPFSIDVWLNLGVVYALSEDIEQAEAAWRKVLRISPDNQRAITYLKKVGKQP